MKRLDNIRCIREYKKKDGTITYHAEIRRKNAKPLRDSFPTLTLAKNWVRKTESALLDGKHVPDNKARKHTLSDLIEQYIRLHLSKHPQRLKDQMTHLNWWNEKYGKRLLIDITPGLLALAKEELLSELTSKKQFRTNSTVNRYFASLSRAFTLAFQEWQWINENPFKRVTKLKENNGRSRYLSREELNRLLESCNKSRNLHLYGMVLIAASMGLRFGEVVNLRWRDIQQGFISLAKTKNGDYRAVPIPDHVANYLQNIERPKVAEEYIFPSKDPSKRNPPSMIRKAFDKALKESGIENFRFHDLRHTCASHLAMNGATQGELMEILGHRTPAMTRRYAHFSKEHISRIIQKTSTNLIDSHEVTL